MKDVPDDFAEFLQEYAHGEANNQMTEKLAELVAAVKRTQKPGKLVLTLAIKAEGDMMQTGFDIKLTRPEPGVPGHLFFATEDGRLTQENPRQMRLPTKIVEPTTAPLRIIPDKKEN